MKNCLLLLLLAVLLSTQMEGSEGKDKVLEQYYPEWNAWKASGVTQKVNKGKYPLGGRFGYRCFH